MKKGPKVAYVLFFYPMGVKIKLIFAVWAAVFEIRTNFRHFHIWS